MTRNLQISLFAGMLAAAGLPLYIHLPRYAATELGLSLQAVGALLIAIRVLDFAQDPLLGRMIDRFPAARSGFAAAAALGMGAGFALLFSLRPGTGVLLWLGAALVLVFTAYSLGSILFYGQSTAFAATGEDLIRMAGFREAGALTGVILAAVAPGVLAALGMPGYSLFGLLLAAICLAVWFATRSLWHLPAVTGGSLSLPALRDAAKDADVQVRRTALAALGFSKSEHAEATLIAGLDDPEWLVREAAAETLAKTGGAGCVTALRSALGDDFWQVRLKAVRSLGRLGARETAMEIAPMMDIPVPNLRKECAAVLGELAVADTLPFLQKYADDTDPDVRKNVRWALGKLAA